MEGLSVSYGAKLFNFDQGKAPPSGGTINVPCFRAEDPGDLGEGKSRKVFEDWGNRCTEDKSCCLKP